MLDFARPRHACLALCACLALLALTFTADTAHAQEQFRALTWEKPSGQVGVRYGTDNMNLGFGAHGGYTINPGVYIGGLFDYFLGESGGVEGISEYSYSFWMLMAEGGYDFGLVDSLVLRPVVAIGVIGVSAETCTSNPLGGGTVCGDFGDTGLELGLGGHVLYAIGKITVGGELRILLGEADAFMFGANVGLVL